MRQKPDLVTLVAVIALGGLAASCGGGGTTPLACNPESTPTGCSGDYQCELIAGGADGGGTARCFPPAYLEVTVTDPTDSDKPVSGARVVVLDADSGVAAAPAATTGGSGVARLPVVWTRLDPDTTPAHSFNLRVSAPGYYEYPGPTRSPLPVSVQRDPTQVLDPASASVHLIPMANAAKGSISGSVMQSDGKTPARGVLVVAETSTDPVAGYSAASDSNGDYVIFNVESRSYQLSGYFGGISFPQTSISVAGAEVHAKLVADAAPLLATVTGLVNIHATGGVSATSAELRIRSTWDVPPGLKATLSGAGPFQITGVPSGTYQALAGWGNDGLVLDPDPSLAATQIQEVSVVGQSPPITVPLSGSFSLVDAVQILSPGASANTESINDNPTFKWKPYTGAAFYRLYLWGGDSPDPIWSLDGSTTPITNETVTYPGTPALVPGAVYQWWVEAWSDAPTPLSHSEDQLGVFEYVAP